MVTAAVSADRRGSGRRAVPFGTEWGVATTPVRSLFRHFLERVADTPGMWKARRINAVIRERSLS